ncbi:substrate-binding domain-containing protein [Streptomyces canus]|uniref:substrate-binding domain-containing protein n=1 Tax=Streptomyces canus TaxID=58343 RepID=UPI00368E80D2
MARSPFRHRRLRIAVVGAGAVSAGVVAVSRKRSPRSQRPTPTAGPSASVEDQADRRSDGASAMAHLLDLEEPPDAVFCYSDLVALGALHTPAARGLRVPEDARCSTPPSRRSRRTRR